MPFARHSLAEPAHGLGVSATGRPMQARIFAAEAACATTSGNRCMSAKHVVPLVSMSAIASSVPSRTYSASIQRCSSGRTWRFSQ